MAITSPSSTQSLSGAVWQQVQQQQAQRAADQAEQNALALQAKARNAQAVADRAQENARSIKVQSDQAEGKAGEARQGLVELESVGGLQAEWQSLRDKLASSTEAAVSAVAAPVINADGQATGTLINVTA